MEEKQYKVFVPDIEDKAGELNNIIYDGIHLHPNMHLCDDVDQADFIFLDFRHIKNGYTTPFPEKTALLDYRDYNGIFDVDVKRYFKRSIVDPHRRDTFTTYDKRIIQISYCVRNSYLKTNISPYLERNIDVSVFLDPNEKNRLDGRISYRGKIATFFARHKKSSLNKYKIHVGKVGNTGKEGRNSFQNQYHEMLANSKIVVTCNPTYWEGDYRLFEALATGCLVFVDKMRTPVLHPFKDGIHLVYYDRDNLDELIKKVKYYLQHPKKARKIAKRGYEFARKHHTTASRMDQVLKEMKKSDKSIYESLKSIFMPLQK